ncbi:MAG: hypothetical protein A2341_07645 [Deltaproteobacteria bacterium RIFOXYB12_FULL_58_9]|nr:MAG: hypothetical protein A2341_07645 [Deltaproteobacteria bacterium RIFOXYB12_FULL_58_9]
MAHTVNVMKFFPNIGTPSDFWIFTTPSCDDDATNVGPSDPSPDGAQCTSNAKQNWPWRALLDLWGSLANNLSHFDTRGCHNEPRLMGDIGDDETPASAGNVIVVESEL